MSYERLNKFEINKKFLRNSKCRLRFRIKSEEQKHNSKTIITNVKVELST